MTPEEREREARKRFLLARREFRRVNREWERAHDKLFLAGEDYRAAHKGAKNV